MRKPFNLQWFDDFLSVYDKHPISTRLLVIVLGLNCVVYIGCGIERIVSFILSYVQ